MTYEDALISLVLQIENGREEPPDTTSRNGLTLLIGGALVTGYMVPFRQYVKLLGKSPEASEGPFTSFLDSVDKHEARLQKLYEKDYEDRTEDEQRALEEDYPHFIHLEDAVILGAAGGSRPINGGLLRVRASSVDAWILGYAQEVDR